MFLAYDAERQEFIVEPSQNKLFERIIKDDRDISQIGWAQLRSFNSKSSIQLTRIKLEQERIAKIEAAKEAEEKESQAKKKEISEAAAKKTTPRKRATRKTKLTEE